MLYSGQTGFLEGPGKFLLWKQKSTWCPVGIQTAFLLPHFMRGQFFTSGHAVSGYSETQFPYMFSFRFCAIIGFSQADVGPDYAKFLGVFNKLLWELSLQCPLVFVFCGILFGVLVSGLVSLDIIRSFKRVMWS